MNVLFVSRKASGGINPFVSEQAAAVASISDFTVQHFLIERGGLVGYIRAILSLHQLLRTTPINLVHVHYGLWGFTAIIARMLAGRRLPIVITYHGSDLNKPSERWISKAAARFAAHNILVWNNMLRYIKKNASIIPCGVDTHVPQTDSAATRSKMGWDTNDFVVLFASGFNRPVKDPAFAHQVINALSKQAIRKVRFIELKGFSRDELTAIMQAANALLMCSHTEGSPQVIKEAIVNGLPVVANDVGEVKDICAGVDHCYVLPKTVDSYVQCLFTLLENNGRITHRKPVIDRYDANKVASQIATLYNRLLNKKTQIKPAVVKHLADSIYKDQHEHSY